MRIKDMLIDYQKLLMKFKLKFITKYKKKHLGIK